MPDYTQVLVETLPLPRRLALAYAPASSRLALLALLAFDMRLAGIVRASHEPMLAQLRLAWWREQLASDGTGWPEGEPLLAALRSWEGRHGALLPLVDGWETMTGAAPLPADAFEALADARGKGFAALVQDPADARRMGRNWGLADIATHVSDPVEAETARTLALRQDWRPARLARALRPLAVLHVLARRGLRREAKTDRIGPADILAALRVGLTGY